MELPAMFEVLRPMLASRLFLVCGAVVAVLLLKIRKKRNKRNPMKDNQVPWPATTALAPGLGTPVMHGVRVVELASVAAAPSVARLFADLGAEVIKVEGPGGAGNGGDPIRDMFLEAASKERVERNVGIFFEGMHCGKKSVCLDLKKDRGALIAMLREADVFVTNVRPHQLKGLGLDYDDIKDELPHLVVAHLVAWGREGPDAGLPGYDISSFWSSTGIAHAVHSPPNYMYSAYPTAFGDCTTGAGLFAGVCAALSRRIETGKGALVENSLYRAGIFCNAPTLLRAPPAKSKGATSMLEHPRQDLHKAPQHIDPTYHVYTSADGVDFGIAGEATDPTTAARLAAALGLKLAAGSPRSKAAELTAAAVAAAVGALEYGAVAKALDGCSPPIPHIRKVPSAEGEGGRGQDAVCVNHSTQRHFFTPFEGVPDVPHMLKAPFEFSCSDAHAPGAKAVRMGKYHG
jgi:crotonobetainyl-CoA:carnitine CoA-transferase CaiB-like acyl-CoA transferase